MNTTLIPMFGRELTDDELATFHGGYCQVTVSKGSNGEVKVTQVGSGCGNVSVNVVVQA